MSSSFIPRARFAFPSVAPTWYIGHMHRGVRKIRETLSQIDLVLEVRDARLPLSTINPAFEKLFGSDRGLLPKNGKKRIIVYNKRDLAEPGLERARSFFRVCTACSADLLCVISRFREHFWRTQDSCPFSLTLARMPMSSACYEWPSASPFETPGENECAEQSTEIGEIDMHRPIAEGDEGPGLRILIAGMPNVGKSSLVNALRRVGVRKGTVDPFP